MSIFIKCLSEAVSPITHMSGTVGNEAVVARELIKADRGFVSIPYLSGNAIRHRAIRQPGMLWLIEQAGLKGKLDVFRLNFLLHGGNLTESSSTENTEIIARMRSVFPLLSVLGGSLPNQILQGSVDVLRGVLVCYENADRLGVEFRDVLPKGRMLPAERFVSTYQYTRGDSASDIGSEVPKDRKNPSQMIYGGQCIAPGAMFLHGFHLSRDSSLCVGAVLHALSLWQQSGGTIGGQGSKGHGRLKTYVFGIDQLDVASLVFEYEQFCRQNVLEMVKWLDDAFPAKKAKKKELASDVE